MKFAKIVAMSACAFAALLLSTASVHAAPAPFAEQSQEGENATLSQKAYEKWEAERAEVSAEAELTKLATPTDLVWHRLSDGSTMYGVISCQAVPDCGGEYYVCVYKDGERIEQTYWHTKKTDGIISFSTCDLINESGSYYFTISAVGDQEFTSDSDTATSETWVYNKPAQSLGGATNLVWDTTEPTKIHYTIPAGSGGAYAFCEMNRGDGWEEVGAHWSAKNQPISSDSVKTEDFSEYMEAGATYRFGIRLLSYNVTAIANGTAVYSSEMDMNAVYSNVGGTLSAAISTGNADQAKAKVEEIPAGTLKAGMQGQEDIYNKITQIEELYKNQKGIEVATNITSSDVSNVKIAGAGLNAQDGTSKVTLNVGRPSVENRKTDPNMRSVLEVSMNLDGVNNPTGTLDVPVCITMPVPSNVNRNTLRIYHYHADGSKEVLYPSFYTIDGVEMLRFAITSFSDFVFADEAPAETGIPGFVERLYQVCLDRASDEAGKADWVGKLTSGEKSGTDVAFGFIFSQEFKNNNYCNKDYVKYLYRAFMGREFDEGGLNDWVSRLESGTTREEVFNGFALSQEFKGLCEQYGIKQGDGIAVPQYGTVPTDRCSECGRLDGITEFVTRLYNVTLDRDPDAPGLADWKSRLGTHTASGRDVAFGFIFSQEFTNRNLSNEDYVEYLYKAFFGRASDAAGKADWVGRLNGGQSRVEVFDGFVGSTEFDNLCKKYGIVRG